MMRRIIAKMWDSRSDASPISESERQDLMREYAKGLMEPERTMFEQRQSGKTPLEISQEMQIDPLLVRRTLARVYANLRVSLAD